MVDLVCVFCEHEVDDDAYACSNCGEYKGLITKADFLVYYGIPWE